MGLGFVVVCMLCLECCFSLVLSLSLTRQSLRDNVIDFRDGRLSFLVDVDDFVDDVMVVC